MVSILAKACICWGNTQVYLQFFANQNFSGHGLPSKSKRPSIRKHSIVVIVTVDGISFYETVICRETFSKYFFASIFMNFQKIRAAHENTFQKVLKSLQKYTHDEAMLVKLQAFTGATTQKGVRKIYWKRPVSGTLNKVARIPKAVEKRLWHKCEFSKISKNTFSTEHLWTTASAFSFSEAATRGGL